MALPVRALWVAVALASACGDAREEPEDVTESPITGQEGNFTVTGATTQLNQYSGLAASASAGATQLTVNSVAELNSTTAQGNWGPLAKDDLLMVIQMRGASITSTDTSAYGTLGALGGAGNYELVTVVSIAGNAITINGGDCGGLKFAYDVTNGRAQVIRVPQVRDLTINSGASIAPLPWDGTRGGVVALSVGGTVTINGSINASTAGFRGGTNNLSTVLNQNSFRGAAAVGAEKGESIAGDGARYDAAFGGRFGKGAPANGGGGGNGFGGPGGGGANGSSGAAYTGAGVMDTTVTGNSAWSLDPDSIGGVPATSSGGGRGGYTRSSANLDALTVGPNPTGPTSWGEDNRRANGGRGGHPVANDPANRLFLGGGGGAGEGNDDGGGGNGGRGGGLVVLVANAVAGSGAINANGGNGGSNTSSDGPGGGGAGGTIVVRANSVTGTVSANALGGAGGGQGNGATFAHGPGGGGGGGYIASNVALTRSVSGIAGGTTTHSTLSEFPTNGATRGATGELATVTDLSTCFGELTLAIVDAPDPVSTGGLLTYTVTVTNGGPSAVAEARVTFPLATNTSFSSASGTGWTCAFAAPNVTCTRATLATGAAPAISLVVNVTATTDTTLTTTATVTAATAEFSSSNNTATVTTTVQALNDPPVHTVPGAQATTEDSPTSFAVSIADPDAAAAAIQTQVSVTNGTLTLNTALGLTFSVGDGTADTTMTFQGTLSAINTALASVTYTPVPNFAGTATFTITTNDLGNTGSGGAKTDSDTVSIAVAGVNDAPVNTVPAAIQSVVEDTPKAIAGVAIADLDAGNAQVEVQLTASGGTMTIGTTGLTFVVGDGVADPAITARGTVAQLTTALANLSYAPPANASGGFTIVLRTSDLGNTGSGGPLIDIDTITLDVTPANDPPDAVDDARTVAEDSSATSLGPLANDSILPDTGETLSIVSLTQPATGSAAIAAGNTNVTFTPAPNFFGTTSFTYTISDGNGGTDTATIVVTVSPVNDPPDAVNDTLSVAEDSGANALPVLANDSIVPDAGETLAVVAVTQPANGTVAIGPSGVTFTPAANFNGATSFSYTISDGNGGTDSATVSVTVTPVNDPPTVVDDTRSVAEDSPPTAFDVLANDSFAPDVGETLSIVSTTQPASGTVVITGTSVTFEPSASFTGVTTFDYTISDGNGGTDTGRVTVSVTNTNDPPTAVDDTATVAEDSTATVLDVLANDTGAPDTGETLTVTSVTQPANGTVVIAGIGVAFTPAKDFFGTTTFAYTISDGNGGNATASVEVTITATNDSPNAKDDFLSVPLDAAATPLDVLANDTSAPDDPETLTILAVTQAAHGTVAITGTGLAFDPEQGFTGLTTFTYTIGDGSGLTDTATVTVGIGDDTDGDHLPDDYELEIGTDPDDADSDDDGVADGSEPRHADDPDGDGLIDALDPDSDNDGLYDGTELGLATAGPGTDLTKQHFLADADPSTSTDPNAADTDGGGVVDGSEDANRDGKLDDGETDPNDPTDDDEVVDTDGDGLSDVLEASLGLRPNDADTDDDGVRDGDEPNFADDTDGDGKLNAADSDSDGDFIKDGTELGLTEADPDTLLGAGQFVADEDPATTTSAIDADTDDGGVDDGDEDENHDGEVDDGERDPNDPADDLGNVDDDTDADGIPDARDNCPTLANPNQADTDNDDVGDACDPDLNGGGLNDDLGAAGGGCSTSSGSAGALLVLALVLGMRRRRWVVLVGLLLLPRLASAQAPRDELRDFSVERFQLATDRNGVLGVEWAEARGHLAFDVSLWLGYANDPLVVNDAGGDRVGALVASRIGGGLVVSISPAPWIALGLEMPVVLSQDRSSNMDVGMLASLASAGSGNLRLIPKLTMLNQQQHGLGLALVPALLLPTQSSDSNYFADDGVTFAPEIDVSRTLAKLRLAGNLGYAVRPRAELLDLVVDDEVFARIGASYRVARPLDVDIMVSTALATKGSGSGYLEAMLGGTLAVRNARIFVAGGAGLHDGFGTPDYRILGGVRFSSSDHVDRPTIAIEKEQTDTDGDGVMDWRDNCKDEPEDKDGFKDSDGCPELDNDEDLVPDATDKCRDEAGVIENQGCPGKDTDVDGIMDHLDKCPTAAEDFDNFDDEDGCPETDNDADGVSDAADECPTTAGSPDHGGCPDPDRDGDGLVDRLDNCPDTAGEQLNAGCKTKQLVAITPGKLVIAEPVAFTRASVAAKSFKLLDNVAAILLLHPTLTIEITVGAEAQPLTQQRADAIRSYLIKKSVEGGRLAATGLGSEQLEVVVFKIVR